MTVQPAERVETDLSVIEALDFEESIACENRKDCPDAATWSVVQTCCGRHAGFVCEPCRIRLKNYMRIFGVIKVCTQCGTQANADAFRFDPIKPGAS